MPVRLADLWRQWFVAALLAALAIAVVCSHAQAETVLASWYGAESGRFNADGSPFNPNGHTAAHRSYPFGTRLSVCLEGACTVVTVCDRGPFVPGRSLDLSRGGAREIGLVAHGVAAVHVIVLEWGRGARHHHRLRPHHHRRHHHHRRRELRS